jgi:hypothetical protein
VTNPINRVIAKALDDALHKTGRAFQAFKNHRSTLYALHGTGHGQLILVGRDYRPLGHPSFADYGDPQFDHLRCDDTAQVRALATSINENGNSNFPNGVRVPILVLLAPSDSRDSYCRRLQALLKVVR